MTNLNRYYRYDQSILKVTESIVSHIKGTGDELRSIEEIQSDAAWLRWRINECWDPPEDPRLQYYDDLVRMLAAEAISLYDHFIGSEPEEQN